MQKLYKQNAGQKVLKTPLWKLQSGLQKQISQIITESGRPLNTNNNLDKLQQNQLSSCKTECWTEIPQDSSLEITISLRKAKKAKL